MWLKSSNNILFESPIRDDFNGRVRDCQQLSISQIHQISIGKGYDV